jgi:hypothetical protein
MSGPDAVEEAGRHLLGLVERSEGVELSEETRRRLFGALICAYARSWRGGAPPPFHLHEVTTDEVVVTAAEMLRACDVTSFEIAAMFNV